MRKLVVFLICAFCTFPLSSKVTGNDRIVALAAVADATLAVSAGFVATPQYALPGCTLDVPDGSSLPDRLSFEGSDLGLYLAVLPQENPSPAWYEKYLAMAAGPLDALTRQVFSVHDWKEGEALLTGDIVPDFPSGMGLKDLYVTALRKSDMTIELQVSVIVRGHRVSGPVSIEGTFAVESKDGYLSIEPVSVDVESAV